MSMRRAFYSIALYLIFPIVLFRLLWRSRSNPAYRKRISERLGFVQLKTSKPIIWIHTVSVGEAIAAKPLIDNLILKYANYRILVTTTTPTGSDQVKALFGRRVEHVYFPYDLLEIIHRFMKRVEPKLLIIVETEIWPNLYAACGKKNIPLIMVNARLSPKSTQSYLKIKTLVAETLNHVDLIAVRSHTDAKNFIRIGAPETKTQVYGNIKFDIQLDETQIKVGNERKQEWGIDRPVWLAASTHKGEDEKILDIHQNLIQQFPKLLLILVPRHPERFESVLALASDYKNLTVIQHSKTSNYIDIKANVILGDSMGEMQSWFASANIAFIGGSLVATGGHNPLEAIAQGVPVVSGKHLFNFEDIVSVLLEEGLIEVSQSQDAVEQFITDHLQSPRSDFKEKSEFFLRKHQGVTERLLSSIDAFLK